MTKILIEVEDGAVTAVHSDEKPDYLDVMILDHDDANHMGPDELDAYAAEFHGAVSWAGVLDQNESVDIHVTAKLPYRVY